MKKLFLVYLGLSIIFASCMQGESKKNETLAQAKEGEEGGKHQLEELWETKELPTPESVLYSAKDQVLYVSLIDGNGMERDGKGGVAILNMDGSIKNKEWFTGMDAPKGLGLHEDLLYVADLTSVSAIDVNSGKEVRKVEVPGAVMLNDITVDGQGRVFVSDTRTNKIHLIEESRVSLYIDSATAVNGLKFLDGSLYALVGPELWKIEADKTVSIVAKGFEEGGDGLEPVGEGDFLVTCWAGLIYYVKATGEIEKLLDTRGVMNTADLGFNAEANILYIPTFNSNSVKAYKLK